MSLPETLGTRRLAGRRVTDDDLGGWTQIYADASVAATLTVDGRPLDQQAVQERLDAAVASWERAGSGEWAFRRRDNGEFVGRANLGPAPSVGPGEVEIGWAVAAPHWQRGFATEMSAAVLAAAWNDAALAALDSIVAFTLPNNAASRRVMAKLGFVYQDTFIHAGLVHVLYRLHRPEPGC